MNDTMLPLLNMPANVPAPGHLPNKPAPAERPARSFAAAAEEATVRQKAKGKQHDSEKDAPDEMTPMAAYLQAQFRAQNEGREESNPTLTAVSTEEAQKGLHGMGIKGLSLSGAEPFSRTDFANLRHELIKPDKGGNLTDREFSNRVPVSAPDEPLIQADTPGRDIARALAQTMTEVSPQAETHVSHETGGKEMAASVMDMRARLAALTHEVAREPSEQDADGPAENNTRQSGGQNRAALCPAPEQTNTETRRPMTRENANGLFAPAQPADPELAVRDTPREASVTPSQVIRQIVQTTAFSQTGNISQIKLQLNPEFLGRVSIVLIAAEDGLSARIQTQSGVVRDMLAANLMKLQNELKDMGINMKSIDITQAGPAGNMTYGDQNSRAFGRDPDSDNLHGTRPITMARFHQAVRTPLPPTYHDGFGDHYAADDEGVDYWA